MLWHCYMGSDPAWEKIERNWAIVKFFCKSVCCSYFLIRN